MRKGYKQLVAEANSAVETIPAAEAVKRLQSDDAIFIDVRDLPELERDGKVPGAIHSSRGVLEFQADPESPNHNAAFSSGKQLILYCASGLRSALAAQRLQEMGLGRVAHVEGGIKAWKEANGPVEVVTASRAEGRWPFRWRRPRGKAVSGA